MAMQIVCFVLSLVVATSLAAECPGAVGNDWVVGKDRCYKFVNRPMSWRSAQKYCSSLGFAGRLAFPDTDEASGSARKAVQSISLVSGVPEWLWIGITDEGNEGVWKSVDGVKVQNLKFREGQPDNAGGKEHYVHIHGKDWNWNDVPEGNKYPFICQAKPVELGENQCPDNWVRRGDLCYKYISSKLNWYDAQTRCSIMGNEGSLAYVGSEADNNNVFEAAGTNGDFWIGVADLRHEGVWSSPFGKRSSFNKWLPNEPNDLSGEDCVHITTTDRKWNDLNCQKSSRPFVCQRSAIVSADRCPAADGWVQRGDNCYRYFRKHGDWNEALSECRRQGPGGTLPFIGSEAKNNEVYEAAAMSAGGEYVDNFKNFWIGVTDKGHSNKWTGPLGQLGSFTKWAKGQPDDGNIFTSEYYVEMLAGSKQWNDDSGDEDAFVCQLPAHAEEECPKCPECPDPEPCPECPPCPELTCPPVTCPQCPTPDPCPTCPECRNVTCPPPPECPTPPPCPQCTTPLPIICPQAEPQKSCPTLWTMSGDLCYRYNVKKLTWQAAQDKCNEDGGSLIKMGFDGSLEFLGDYITMIFGGVNNKKSYSWVDLNDKENEGVFVDSDGGVFEGNVDEEKKKQKSDCVMFKKGNLSHDKCSNKRVFVCEKPVDLILPEEPAEILP